MKGALRVEQLWLYLCIYSGTLGCFALIAPHLVEWVLFPHGEKLSFRDNSQASDQEPHLLVRLYGACYCCFAYILFCARTLDDAIFRRSLIRSFFLLYLLHALTYLRAQLVRDTLLSTWNWLNILFFSALATMFGWFVFYEPLKSFQLPHVSQWH